MTIVSYPTQSQNYCIFTDDTIKRANKGDSELELIKQELKNPRNEEQVIEDLYVLNLMLDKGVSKKNAGLSAIEKFR